jgi:hypothetical protein
VQLGGTASGSFYFDGDQSRIKLVYSATDDAGNPLIYSSEAGHDYAWCDGIALGRCKGARDEVVQQLNLTSYPCGVRVVNGGTGWARKALPFGLSVGSRIWRPVPLTFRAGNTWGEASIPLPASSNTAPACSAPLPTSPPPAGDGSPPPSQGGYTPTAPPGATYCYHEWETIWDYDSRGNVTIIAVDQVICR